MNVGGGTKELDGLCKRLLAQFVAEVRPGTTARPYANP
jgi:hypothetical protein